MSKLFLFLMFFLSLNLNAQVRQSYKIEYLNISFDSKFDLEQDIDEYDPTWIFFENKDFVVDVMADSFENESAKFIEDAKYGANEIAQDMEFVEVKDGGSLQAFSRGYYVIAEDELSGDHFPVIIAALYDDTKKIAYEIIIDCYNDDIEEAVRILNSFKRM